MIQSFEDLNKLEEYPPRHVVEEFVDFVLKNSVDEPLTTTFEKLEELSDKQWHTYELPSDKVKQKLKNFIISHWTDNTPEFLESVLIISACFALDKVFFKTVLDNYKGESFKEFETDLLKSPDETIDPYWSLKK